jgi:hypothetical protein
LTTPENAVSNSCSKVDTADGSIAHGTKCAVVCADGFVAYDASSEEQTTTATSVCAYGVYENAPMCAPAGAAVKKTTYVSSSVALELELPAGKTAADIESDASFAKAMEVSIAAGLPSVSAEDVQVTQVSATARRLAAVAKQQGNLRGLQAAATESTTVKLRVSFRIKTTDAAAAETIKQHMSTQVDSFKTNLASELSKELGVKVTSVDVAPAQVVTEVQVSDVQGVSEVQKETEPSSGAIVGAVVGGCLLGIVALVAGYFAMKKLTSKKGAAADTSEGPAAATMTAVPAATMPSAQQPEARGVQDVSVTLAPQNETATQESSPTWAGRNVFLESQGKVWSLNVSSTTSLAELRRLAQEQGIENADHGEMLFDGQVMSDDRRNLGSYGIQQESHLQLSVARMRV